MHVTVCSTIFFNQNQKQKQKKKQKKNCNLNDQMYHCDNVQELMRFG